VRFELSFDIFGLFATTGAVLIALSFIEGHDDCDEDTSDEGRNNHRSPFIIVPLFSDHNAQSTQKSSFGEGEGQTMFAFVALGLSFIPSVLDHT